MARRKTEKLKLNGSMRKRILSAIISRATFALAEGCNPHEAYTDAIIDLTSDDDTLLSAPDKWALEAMDEDMRYSLFYADTIQVIS